MSIFNVNKSGFTALALVALTAFSTGAVYGMEGDKEQICTLSLN